MFAVEIEASAEPKPTLTAMANLNAVVVDEDDESRAELAGALAAFGLSITQLRKLEELDAARNGERPPDLALIDLQLAVGEHGADAIAAFVTRFANLPIAFVSQQTSGASFDAARASGQPVLPKPVTPLRLRAALLHLVPPGKPQ
ncbi:MAG: response regulator [bacterium]|nr:response regulator [bacterium]